MKWEYRVDKMPIRSGGFVGNGMNVDAVDEEDVMLVEQVVKLSLVL